jgi:methionyl-tRNA formyltransferase
MRIILIGQAAFAQRVLDGLRERGHDVAAVYCPPDAPGAKTDPLKGRSLELGIPVHQHATLKDAAVAAEFGAYRPDLGVLAYVTQIVPPAVFDAPRLGSICFHPPCCRYRGGSAIPWQLIKGETRTGVTVFGSIPASIQGRSCCRRAPPWAPTTRPDRCTTTRSSSSVSRPFSSRST